MAHNYDEEKAPPVGDDHARLLYSSLEQFNKEQKGRKRPSILLAAVIFLFLSSAGGTSLAIVLMLQPTEVQSACIARDLVLFAAAIAFLYICLHIRGARKNPSRRGPGPPQIYGDYLHASALLTARLGIAVWVAALVATAIMIAKANHLGGLAGMAPYLNLVICIGAIPSFIVISATIESNPTPFTTTGLTPESSFLSCRVSEFADDLCADQSVSRRASLQRKESKSDSILTLPTAEIFKMGSSTPDRARARNPNPLVIRTNELPYDRTELMANSPIGATHNIPMTMNSMPLSSHPPMPQLPPKVSKSLPKSTNIPGGWPSEWDHVAEQPRTPERPVVDGSNIERSGYLSSGYSSESGGSSRSSTPSNGTGKAHRATPSTSITSSAQRSRLSTVRYAAEPEIAVRQPIRVIKNPNYSPAPPINTDTKRDFPVIRPPEPVVVAGNVHLVQNAARPTLKRQPSNFSRPLPPSRGSEADSAVAMKIPGTFDDELKRR